MSCSIAKIKIHCKCGASYETRRDLSAPKTAISMGCNFCPTCENNPSEHYKEWYNHAKKEPKEHLSNPDQLELF